MTVFSSLRQLVVGGGLGSRLASASTPSTLVSSSPSRWSQALGRVFVRHGSGGGAGAGGHGRKMVVKVSEYHKRRFLDELHYQICLCALPFVAIIIYANVFVGQATLTEIPEDYEPEHWEYFKHPIQRFFAKYFEHPEPVLYEIVMSRHHQQILEMEKIEWEKKVIELMRERQDYKAWYYFPADSFCTEKASAHWRDLVREEGEGPKGASRLVDADF